MEQREVIKGLCRGQINRINDGIVFFSAKVRDLAQSFDPVHRHVQVVKHAPVFGLLDLFGLKYYLVVVVAEQ